MIKLPKPVIEEWKGRYILRDDLLPGGTKRRALPSILKGGREFVYASPSHGYAQLALAHACRDLDAQATIFVAKRAVPTSMTAGAAKAGAKVIQVPHGYLKTVQARAREYCEQTGASLVPFGVDHPDFIAALALFAKSLPVVPTEVWSVAGSGTLNRALHEAWPAAKMYAVRIGREPILADGTELFIAPEVFEKEAKIKPPFPSCPTYDAKAWRYFSTLSRPGALFWNVGA